HLTVRQTYILAPAAERIEETFPDMLEIEARAVERGSFLFPDLRFPRQDPLPGIDMRVRQPRLCRRDQAVRNQRAMIACEMADDRIAPLGRAPRQGECAFRKFVGMRDIKGGRQRRFFTDPIGPQDLGEFEDFRLIALDLRERDRAVACAEVDAETEPMVHGWLISSCLKALCHIRES